MYCRFPTAAVTSAPLFSSNIPPAIISRHAPLISSPSHSSSPCLGKVSFSRELKAMRLASGRPFRIYSLTWLRNSLEYIFSSSLVRVSSPSRGYTCSAMDWTDSIRCSKLWLDIRFTYQPEAEENSAQERTGNNTIRITTGTKMRERMADIMTSPPCLPPA